jgi:hypothetical protein
MLLPADPKRTYLSITLLSPPAGTLTAFSTTVTTSPSSVLSFSIPAFTATTAMSNVTIAGDGFVNVPSLYSYTGGGSNINGETYSHNASSTVTGGAVPPWGITTIVPAHFWEAAVINSNVNTVTNAGPAAPFSLTQTGGTGTFTSSFPSIAVGTGTASGNFASTTTGYNASPLAYSVGRIAFSLGQPSIGFGAGHCPNAWWITDGARGDSYRELKWPLDGPLVCQPLWVMIETSLTNWGVSITTMDMLDTPCAASYSGNPYPQTPDQFGNLLKSAYYPDLVNSDVGEDE